MAILFIDVIDVVVLEKLRIKVLSHKVPFFSPVCEMLFIYRKADPSHQQREAMKVMKCGNDGSQPFLSVEEVSDTGSCICTARIAPASGLDMAWFR